MPKTDPTPRQREIADFCLDHLMENGHGPAIAQIQAKFDFKSPNAVRSHLYLLGQKGVLEVFEGRVYLSGYRQVVRDAVKNYSASGN